MPVTPATSLRYVPHRDYVYDFLRSRGPANLYVDVGAASGAISSRIATDTARVVGIRAFPHNARVFRSGLLITRMFNWSKRLSRIGADEQRYLLAQLSKGTNQVGAIKLVIHPLVESRPLSRARLIATP